MNKSKRCTEYENNSNNFKIIEFLTQNNIEFNITSIKNEMKKFEDIKIKYENQIEDLRKKIELLYWVDNNKLNYYYNNINIIKSSLIELEEICDVELSNYRKIIGDRKVDSKIVSKRKKKILKNREYNNEKLNVLNSINFDGEIQEYLKYKAKIENNLKELLNNKNKCIIAEKRLTLIYDKAIKIIEKKIESVLNTPLINDFYKKIEPHPIMNEMKYLLKFNDSDKPELEILVSNSSEEYLPDWYFSSAQLNVVALTTFLARANTITSSPINTIFIDDPVGHFDEINIIAFVDLLRAILEKNNKQLIISTHDQVVYNLLKRKLPPEYYYSKFIQLGYREQ